MSNPRRKLVAIVAAPEALKLGSRETGEILGDWQIWHPEGSGVHYLVCRVPARSDGYSRKMAERFLSNLGATVLPDPRDPQTTVEELAPKEAGPKAKPLPAGVAATDTGWQAHRKLFELHGWPPFDPTID